MDTIFEVAACHSNHAGKAYLTLHHPASGATVLIQHLPFDYDQTEPLETQQHRIATRGLALVRAAVDYLESQLGETCRWSEIARTIGAAPRENEPPNAFGYPMERR